MPYFQISSTWLYRMIKFKMLLGRNKNISNSLLTWTLTADKKTLFYLDLLLTVIQLGIFTSF